MRFTATLVSPLVLLAACDQGLPNSQVMWCELAFAEGDFDQFLVDINTGALVTGLENVCCDRALSMENTQSSNDGIVFRAEYATTLHGIGYIKYNSALTIDLDAFGGKPFRLESENEDTAIVGDCRSVPRVRIAD